MNTRNKMLTGLTSAAFAAALFASAAKSAWAGDIYSIEPVWGDESNFRMNTSECSDNPLVLGERGTFVFRLYNPGVQTNTLLRNQGKSWKLVFKGAGSETLANLTDALPGIGVIVSGRLKYAAIVDVAPTPGGNGGGYGLNFTDVKCRYTVEGGDIALPLTLADEHGFEIGSNDSSASYYFYNPYSWWSIEDEDGNPVTLSFGMANAPAEIAVKPTAKRNYSLASLDDSIYIRAVDFDDEYDTSDTPTYWRRVYEGMTTTKTSQPSIFVPGGNSTNEVTTLYLWVEDTNCVRLAETTDTYSGTVRRGGELVSLEFPVQKVSLARGQTNLTFRLEGVTAGTTAQVFLAATPGYRTNPANDVITNFVTRTVYCETAPDPFISITFARDETEAEVVATTNYQRSAVTMYVKLSKEYDRDIWVDINPTVIGNATFDLFEEKVIGISLNDGNYNNTFTHRIVKVPAGKTQVPFYVYALGSTSDTSAYEGGVTFTPTLADDEFATADDAQRARDFFNGDYVFSRLRIDDQSPVVVSPENGKTYSGWVAQSEQPVSIRIKDNYRDLRTNSTYTVKWSYGDGSTTPFLVVPDGEYLNVTVKYPTKGEFDTTVIVLDPNGHQSDELNLKVNVLAPKTISAVLYDSTEQTDPNARQTYAEGDTPYLKFSLSQAHTADLYAYLVPLNEASSNLVSSAAFESGVVIPANATMSTPVNFTLGFLDGGDAAANLQFGIMLRNDDRFDAGDEVAGIYTTEKLYLNVTNIAPSVSSVEINGGSVANGGTFESKVSSGVPTKFDAVLSDPALIDVTNGLVTCWTIRDGVAGYYSYTKVYVTNDTVNASCIHTFTAGGETQVVTVKAQDKDMALTGQWGPEYTFSVNVDQAPYVQILPSSADRHYAEDGKEGYLRVALSTPASAELTIELEAVSQGLDGILTFKTNIVTVAAGSTMGMPQNIPFGDLDGTVDSRSAGFLVTARVTTDTLNQYDQPWSDYYKPGSEYIYIDNVAPVISRPAESAITNKVTLNSEKVFAWSVKDIAEDLTNGLTVTWTSSGGEQVTFTGPDVATGSYTNTFTAEGPQQVSVLVEDKDGGQATRTWYFMINPTKQVTINPYGPAGSTLTKYDTAKGRGKGRVWGNSGTYEISGFRHTWFYDVTAAQAQIHAFGYAASNLNGAGNPLPYYDDGTLNGSKMDVALTATGNKWSTTPVSAQCYKYQDKYDNFFYCWVDASQTACLDTANVPVSGVPHPASTPLADSMVSVTLDAYEEDKAAYEVRNIEAIFAKEKFASDNMGDINADGIPDLYYKTFWYGATAGGEGATDTADDLANLSQFNDDNDFLPGMGQATSSLIPGLPESWVSEGSPFTAYLEIRGFGDGLNNAPAQFSFDSTPELDFKNPSYDAMMRKWYAEAGTVGIDWIGVEWLAYNELSDAEKESWSPENPTDPTKEDTDGDGFTDGYEYYYWYYAKVGYIDEVTGRHVYLTGSKYNPADPARGDVISSADIIGLFDPNVYNAKAQTRDSDNDGLTDLQEFFLGSNPIQWDTDGDGLPDGYEVLIGTNPLTASTTVGVHDAYSNPDNDYMAYSLFDRKAGEDFRVFCVLADAKGHVGYVAMPAQAEVTTETTAEAQTGWRIAVEGGLEYFTLGDANGEVPYGYNEDGEIILQCELAEYSTWIARQTGDEVWVRGMPMFVPRGTVLSAEPEYAEWYDEYFTMEWKDDSALPNHAWHAWQYGKSTAPICTTCDGTGRIMDTSVIPAVEKDCPDCDGAGYLFGETTSWGNYMLGYDLNLSPGLVVFAELNKPVVGLVHHYVYQWRQFDPRTAWGEPEPPFASVNSRPYATYDEFLLISFFYNTKGLNENAIKATSAKQMLSRWGSYNTNPLAEAAANDTGLDVAQTVAGSGNHGADTDGDGVPDGWELYVMSGPKDEKGRFTSAAPSSIRSPLVNRSWSGLKPDEDNDGLSNIEEFESREATAWYSEKCQTIKHSDGWQWYNKHWPTDPWNTDTDDDGVADDTEQTAFAYGTPVAQGPANVSTPGGGLNPLSWDTDGDGLPDAWELQFAGSATAIAGEASTETAADAAAGQTMEIADGMDGTVKDGDKDYDADGLVNWQEYKTAAMRCWRYDDPMAPWGKMPEVNTDDPSAVDWGNVLLNRDDPTVYNPHLTEVFDPTAYYYSLQTNDWDVIAYKKWYMFCDGPYHDLSRPQAKYKEGNVQYNRWTYYAKNVLGVPCGQFPGEIQYLQRPQQTMTVYPTKYFSTSPINHDSDGDGMDDYYEVFHGMNPILGEPMTNQDLIFEAYGGREVLGSTFNGISTFRSPMCAYDFIFEPWLAGVPTADPDGDNVRNQEEAIIPQVQALSTWHHTDPTPLWMTDSSYQPGEDIDRDPGSLTTRYYVPALGGGVDLPEKTFTWDSDGDGTPETYAFSQFIDMYREINGMPSFDNWRYTPANVSVIPVPGAFYSFEENEGYDSDHDGLSDFAEAQGKYRNASDGQDDDSPRRHQAMYFNGTDAFLETLPESVEGGEGAPNNNLKEMMFLEYTVEAWVKAEEPEGRAQTIVERAIASGVSHVGDEKYVRRNFSIGIDANGNWCAKHDSRGTDALQTVEVTGTKATTEWTHVAATFGAKAGAPGKLTLYVNGVAVNSLNTDVQPENGTAAISIDNFGAFGTNKVIYTAVALLVGAGTDADADPDGQGIWALSPFMLPEYSNFGGYFKGYVDEVRIWDGARSAAQISSNYKKRFVADDIRQNRAVFYNQYAQLGSRSDAANEDLEPELRYLFGFDHTFGADSPEHVAKVPAGFDYSGVDGKAILSRPAGWVCPWWAGLPCVSTVYTDYAWVPWINNMYAHLDRFDGSTKDSRYWSKYYAGLTSAWSAELSMFSYTQTHEVYSYWTQAAFGTAAKYKLFSTSTNQADRAMAEAYAFARRQQLTSGADLLPFGGAYVKYVNKMWDDGKPSSLWEVTGTDSDNDGLPDWWEAQYGDVNWDDMVTYNGVEMLASEAYIRSLAAGAHEGSAAGDELYAQSSDLDKDGVPDWWEQIYKIEAAGGNDDTDNDGLSNYTEYVISEAFRSMGVYLNPVKLRSDDVTLDYFRTVGYLYIGEMFTDHDMMEDDWESSLGDLDYTSPWVWDASFDKDEDGWSTFAECRYNYFRCSLVANLISHVMGEEEVRDIPRPTIRATFRYHGSQNLEKSGSENVTQVVNGIEDNNRPGVTFYVNAYSSYNPVSGVGPLQTPDATFKFSPGESVSDTLYLGAWEDRVVHVTFAPGYLDLDSLKLEVGRVPRSDSYSWSEDGEPRFGTYAQYMSAMRANPRGVVLATEDFNWGELSEHFVTVTTDSTGVKGYICFNGERVGWIDLQTGEASIDLSPLQQYATYMAATTDENGNQTSASGAVWSMTDAILRMSYSAKFADLDGDGAYTAGEPMGMVRNVDVGWGNSEFAIELTDVSPVFGRIKLSDVANDRDALYGTESGNFTDLVPGSLSGAKFERIRVVRTLVDGVHCALLGVPERPVVDKWVNLEDCRDYLFEGDVLDDSNFDLDWEYFGSEVLSNSRVRQLGLPVTNVIYRIVLGNGSIESTENSTNNMLSVAVSRRFDASRTIPTPVSPVNGRTVYSARPTFEWSMGEINSYTAFKVRISSGGSVVYDSGVQPAPARNGRGNYEWTAPVCANSMTSSGKMFSSTNNYTWAVTMYNSKYQSDAFSSVATTGFRMNTNSTKPVADNGYTEIAAKVSYYGPDKVLGTVANKTSTTGKVRVQAYASPDFAGDPIAETIVTDKASLQATDRAVNAVITGLPEGEWYICAYIDTNGNLKRDEWESWGYACNREMSVAGYSQFSPVPVTIDRETIAVPECDIYIEDCDTDGDWFPDAYEMVEKKSLSALGPVTSPDGLVNVNANLATSISHELSASLCTIAGPDLATLQGAEMAALILGVDTTGSSSARTAVAKALNAQTLEPEGVSIKSISVDGGVVSVTSDVDLTVNAGGLSTAASIYTGQVSGDVVYKVWYKKNLTDAKWTLLSTQTKYLSESGEVVSDIQITGSVDPESGFFKVTLE